MKNIYNFGSLTSQMDNKEAIKMEYVFFKLLDSPFIIA